MFFFIMVSGKKKTKISSLDTGYKSISHRRNRPVCPKINIITLVELKEKCWSQNTIYYLTVVHFLNFHFFWCLFFLNNEKKIKNHLTQRKEHQAGVSQFTFVNSLPVTSSFPNTVGVNIPTTLGSEWRSRFRYFFHFSGRVNFEWFQGLSSSSSSLDYTLSEDRRGGSPFHLGTGVKRAGRPSGDVNKFVCGCGVGRYDGCLIFSSRFSPNGLIGGGALECEEKWRFFSPFD